MINANYPAELKQFIKEQRTIPAPEEKPQYPYAEYWVKAIMCILLSGRVRSSADDNPNRSDITRVCKQANFDEGLFEYIACQLIGIGVIQDNLYSEAKQYEKGNNFNPFWNHDFRLIQAASRKAFLDSLRRFPKVLRPRPSAVQDSGLVEFLKLFFGCFKGRALPVKEIGQAFLAFSQLPEDVLQSLMKEHGIKDKGDYDWESWLDETGQEFLVQAIGAIGWANSIDHNKSEWGYLNQIGQMMLGLTPVPKPPEAYLEFKVLSNLSVLAGSDLPVKTLSTLFRYCKIVRIDRIIEFRFDKKAMLEMPSKTSANEELLEALKAAEPLPSTVKTFLEDKKQIGGVISVRYCSAIVKPENPEMLHAIYQHPKLKGYIVPNFQQGFLLVKYGSNPSAFITKCREHGFEVKDL